MEKNNIGRLTIPTDSGFVNETLEIAKKWGADAVRDCDGTVMPDEITDKGFKVYSTYFVIRGDNEWADANLDELQHAYLMSERNMALSNELTIEPLKGYFDQQLEIDYESNPKKYWQVYDRTTNSEVSVENWEIADEKVIVHNTIPFHQYTVSFLAKSIWDPVQMYNYITNDWDGEKQKMYDPAYPKTAEYIKSHLKQWIKEHPKTNVIRFTTFLYQFSLVFNDKAKEKYVDWFGYTMSVSPKILDLFEKEYGYRLTAEDIIDNGYYNNTFRLPTKKFLDYIDFIQCFVSKKVKELVEITHDAGKEAMMFLGDCWIGAEPYGKYFKDIGLDAVVGSVGGGVTVRMLTDIQGVKYVEGRFLPYFFPDTFYEGNDPTIELNQNWLTARRSMLRKPLDRIGFGGYLSLANKFPKFIDRVSEISREFNQLYDNIHGITAYSQIKIAILNSWGKLRSWQSHMVAHELWYQQIYSYQGTLEALSGMPLDVSFISFDDILNDGIPDDINVIINVGEAGTAFSGGSYWANEQIQTRVREFVYNGGGFIGIGEPTAYELGGKFFQLDDVMGVNKEIGFSLSSDKYNINKSSSHFITEDVTGDIDYGEGMKNIYALNNAEVIDIIFSDRLKRSVNAGEVMMAANDFGKGRGIYISGLPFSFQNARILLRAMYYSCRKEKELKKAYCDSIFVDCHYYETKKLYALVNNSKEKITTTFYNIDGKEEQIELMPMEIKWVG